MVVGCATAANAVPQPLQKSDPTGLARSHWGQRSPCANEVPHLLQKLERGGLSAPQSAHIWRNGSEHLAQNCAVSRLAALQ
jgi:hypothetical protein